MKQQLAGLLAQAECRITTDVEKLEKPNNELEWKL